MLASARSFALSLFSSLAFQLPRKVATGEAHLVGGHLGRSALGDDAAAGKRWRGLAQSEVAQAQIVQDLQLVPHLLQVGERGKRLVIGESEHLGKR